MRILLFHVNILKQAAIRDLCKDLGIDVRVAAKEDYTETIGQIAGIQASPGRSGSSGKAVLFSDEMMVFCGMKSDQLDRFLEEYRKRDIEPVMLKAVLTPYNARWTPGKLCMELKKEQQSLK